MKTYEEYQAELDRQEAANYLPVDEIEEGTYHGVSTE